MNEAVFTPGQVVRAVASVGWCITKGTLYTVTRYDEAVQHQHFRFPPYVTVLDDFGIPATFHTHRFVAVGDP